MAQEDKGLVLRGLILLALIGGLVTFVLALLFWRPQEQTTTREQPAETCIPYAAVPMTFAGFPSGISWPALSQLGETLPSAPGWGIRYNAAATLARLGSAHVPWPLICEMLDEKLQMRNQRVRLPDGATVADEAAARAFVIAALHAVSAWHDKQKKTATFVVEPDLAVVYKVVDTLADSPVEEVKVLANQVRGKFFR